MVEAHSAEPRLVMHGKPGRRVSFQAEAHGGRGFPLTLVLFCCGKCTFLFSIF